VDVDMTDVVRSGGVFAPLRDSQVFLSLRRGPRGRTIEWLDKEGTLIVDFDADVLYRMGRQQASRSGLDRFLRAIVDMFRAVREAAH
jgi:hypothetical protein